MQRLANVLGSELTVCSEREASLRGAAIFALEKLGWKVSASAKGQVIRPQPAVARKYSEARRRHLKLEKHLIEALYG
jgi:gluconokinase